jgi:hypothetical protein
MPVSLERPMHSPTYFHVKNLCLAACTCTHILKILSGIGPSIEPAAKNNNLATDCPFAEG